MGDNVRTKNNMGEFSEFELLTLMMKIGTSEKYEECGAVGTAEETLDSKTVSKKYRGAIVKQRTRGTGSGNLKLSLHMNYDMYNKTLGMASEELKEGVYAYGMGSKHGVFSLTALVLDEDDRKKLKAYPNCTVITAPPRKIENGGEEVAEIDFEVAINPDEYGNGMYEALYDEIDEGIREEWLTNFTPKLVRINEA